MTKNILIALLTKYATIPNTSKTKLFISADSIDKIAGEIMNLTKVKKGFIPPTIEEVIEFFKSNGYDPKKGEEVFKYYDEATPPWTDRNGDQVLSWKSKIRANWFRDEFKIKETKDKMVH